MTYSGDFAELLRDRHVLLAGGTGVGKSGQLQLLCRSLARNPAEAFTLIDPHGAVARAFAEWAANPANGVSRRVFHFFDPASDYAFGINPLDTGTHQPRFEDCHDCASVVVAAIGSFFDQKSESTPRMVRLIYVAAFVCTYKSLTLLDVLEMFALGAHELRRALLHDFNNAVVRRELEDLIELAERHPQRFIELVESTKNRLVRWLADPRLARILGVKRGIKPRRFMDGREIPVFDLSCFSIDDAAFIATLLTTLYFAHAKRRPPNTCARHRLIGDEFECMVVDYTAKLVDQARKFGLFLVCSVQRLSQLVAKGQFVTDALLTNCHLQLIFGRLPPADARLMTELIYTGHLNVGAEWIPGSERPVAVGHEKQITRSRSQAHHEAEHEARSITESQTSGEAIGTMTTASAASGDFSASGDSAGLVMQAPAQLFGPNAPGAQALPVPLTESTGDSRSRGSSEMSSSSSGTSHVAVEMHGRGETQGYGRSRGSSIAEGTSEAFVPTLEWLPSGRYSLEEQLHRAQAIVMNLAARSCVVKVAGEAPFVTRTADLTPAFHSPYFKRLMVPRFLRATSERSPYLIPVADADAELAARLTPPSPPARSENFATREPLPVVDNPIAYASDYWKTRTQKPQPPTRKKRPGRTPKGGHLKLAHERFRVIDGTPPGDTDK